MKNVFLFIFLAVASQGLAKPEFAVSLSLQGSPKDTLLIRFKTVEEKNGIWAYGIKKLTIEYGFKENNVKLGNPLAISFETVTPNLSLPALGYPQGEVAIKGGPQPLIQGDYALTINGEKYGKIRVIADNCATNPRIDPFLYCIKEATLVP